MKLHQWVHHLFVHPKERDEAKAPSKATSYYGQRISRRYCLAAVSLFTLQGIVALLGATELIKRLKRTAKRFFLEKKLYSTTVYPAS